MQNSLYQNFSFPRALTLGLLLGLTSFWNGSMVLGALMVLGFLFFFSRHRIELVIIAILALGITYLATIFFAGGGAKVKPEIWYGILAQPKTWKGIGTYYLLLFGLMPLTYFLGTIFAAKNVRLTLVAFLLPFIFANTIKLTPDINANHKFVLIFEIATSLASALVINFLFQSKFFINKFLSVILIFILTCTGVYDFVSYYRLNQIKNFHFKEDALFLWTGKNTQVDDLFLTPMVATHPILMAGRNIYFGWPYFAWSAGYDVPPRMEIYRKIYSALTAEELRAALKGTHIRYILFEEILMSDLPKNGVYQTLFTKVFAEPARALYKVPQGWSD